MNILSVKILSSNYNNYIRLGDALKGLISYKYIEVEFFILSEQDNKNNTYIQ